MKFFKYAAMISVGAIAGFLYWYYIGCTSGSCAITSSPVNSTIYGAIMGGLLLNMFIGSGKSHPGEEKNG
jgi:hypothetical protein